MKSFDGIYPALLTPFDDKGKISEKALVQLIEMNLKKGVTGFYVGGTTAEAFLLSDSERNRLYRIVREVCPPETVLIAHIGSISTDAAVSFGETAVSLGYDAVSAVAPFYYHFSGKEIKGFYRDLTERVPLPLFIYNFPAYSGVELSFEDLSELLADPRVIGVKHTSSDFFKMQKIKAAFPDKTVFNGYDEMFAAGLAMGADGGIGSTYNFMAEKFIAIRKLFSENRIAELQAIQARANTVIAALCRVGVMQGEKAILEAMGIPFGDCRAPFAPLDRETKAALAREILPILEEI